MDEKPTPTPRKTRRRLTAEKKYEIFLATLQNDKAMGDILRQEGLYGSDLARYRKLIREGALEKLRTSAHRGLTMEQKRIEALEAQIRQRDEVIARLSMERMTLEKKVNGE
jgi:transposase-like protein